MKNKLLVSVSALLALSSCSSVRQSMGLESSAPNEYAVDSHQVGLEMPPDFYKLPTPEPGAPRPQEIPHSHKAKELLTGQSSHSHHTHSHAESSGTSSFLQEAGVEGGQDHVRSELNQKAEVEKRKGGTVVQQLGLKERTSGTALKPVEEQARLQKEGITTSQYVDEDEDEDADED